MSAFCTQVAERLIHGMQATGTYISRSLSYTGAEFAIIRVEVDPVFKVYTFNRCTFEWHTCLKKRPQVQI